jgi:hypothetical protein
LTTRKKEFIFIIVPVAAAARKKELTTRKKKNPALENVSPMCLLVATTTSPLVKLKPYHASYGIQTN